LSNAIRYTPPTYKGRSEPLVDHAVSYNISAVKYYDKWLDACNI